MTPIEIIVPLERHGSYGPKDRTRMVLAALAESGADLDAIQINKPKIEGPASDRDRAQVRPHAYVTFKDPIQAALFLVSISDERERASQFKLFWGGSE